MGNIEGLCIDKSNHKIGKQKIRKESRDKNHYSEINFTQNCNVSKPETKTTTTASRQTKQEESNKTESKNNEKMQQQQALLSLLEIPQPQNYKIMLQKSKYGEKGQNNSISHSHGEEQNKSSFPNSIDDFNIPISSMISQKSSCQQLLSSKEIQIILSSKHLSIEEYKNFCLQTKRDKQNNLITSNPFSCFCQLIFELYSTNDSKIQLIKDKIIKIQRFVQNTYIQQQNDYGEITDCMHIKKIFLEYFIKLLNNESSITIMENYSILEFLVEPIVISIISQINTQIKQQIENKYQQRIFDYQFFTIVADSFKLQFKKQDNTMIFKAEDEKQLIIEEIQGLGCKARILK